MVIYHGWIRKKNQTSMKVVSLNFSSSKLTASTCPRLGWILRVGRIPKTSRNSTCPGSVFEVYLGVSLNGGTPKTPQNDHF